MLQFAIKLDSWYWYIYSKLKATELNWLIWFLMMTVNCSISWHYSVNAAEHHRKLLEVDSFKGWPKRVLLFKTWQGKDIIGLQRMIMVRKKG